MCSAAYLAGRLGKVLQEKQQKDLEKEQKDLREKQEIQDQDILCVQIAALCYNLGECQKHPFSGKYILKMLSISNKLLYLF